MSIVSISDRRKNKVSVEKGVYKSDLDHVIEEELLLMEDEEDFQERIKTPEDDIFADADRIVLRMGDAVNKSRISLVGRDGRFIRSKDISNDEMIKLFRIVTKTHLTNDAELKNIRNRLTKGYYQGMEGK